MITPKIANEVCKKLLCLSSFLPIENMEVWVTIDELHGRLVVAGVDSSLTTAALLHYLTTANKSNFMSKRPDGDPVFYHPSALDYESGTPLDQQSKLTS